MVILGIFFFRVATLARAQFHGSAYRRQGIGAYGSREFFAHVERIHGLADNFCLCTCAEIRRLHSKRRLVIASQEICPRKHPVASQYVCSKDRIAPLYDLWYVVSVWWMCIARVKFPSRRKLIMCLVSDRIMDFDEKCYASIPSWTHNQSSDGSASSLCPSSSTSTQHTELTCSDFRSSKDYDGYGTVELFLFNPQDYPDESERQRRFDYFVKNIVPSKFNWPENVKEIRVLSPSYVEDEGLGDTESLRADGIEPKLTPNRVNFHSIKKLASAHK